MVYQRRAVLLPAVFYISSMEKYAFRKVLSIFLYSFAIIVLASCKPSAAPHNETPLAAVTNITENILPAKGTIHPSLNTKSNASITYSLYIPTDCIDGKRWPVIVLFDPQGRGTIPLKKYRESADKHKMILMCSNTSKNGNNLEESNKIIKSLIQEAIQQLPADSNRIYAGGFSGGGRVATLALPQYRKLRGIISIAAGSTPVSPVNTCRYIGISGLQDFNYKEINTASKTLTGKMSVTTLFHPGMHEWCPAETMDDAMLILDADAMRDRTLAINKTMLSKEAEMAQQDAGGYERTGNYMAAVDRISFAVDCLKGISENKELSAYYKRLTSSPAYEKAKKEKEELDKEQELLTGNYLQMIGEPLEKYESALGKLRFGASKDTQRYFMLKRILASLSIQCYMMCKQNIYKAPLKDAEYLSKLYLMIDPENKDSHYYAAVFAGRTNKPDEVYKELNESIRLGLTDKTLVMNEIAFKNFSNTTQFNRIIQMLENLQINN